MSFFLIKGTFHVKGYSPDGDSIRFEADEQKNWEKLSGKPVEVNARGHVQIRFEGVDTLETHYGGEHQPLPLAIGALEWLLSGLGITGVEWNEGRTEITAADDGTKGYILSRTTGEYRRPIAFVHTGDPPEEDGSEVFLNVDRMRESLNYRSIEEGMAYPTYYEGLFSDLREALTGGVEKAREAGLGVWAEDRTNGGFEVKSLKSITEGEVILPKLFRRLVEYLGGGGEVAGFEEWLGARQEKILILSSGHFTHFDTVVEVEGSTVRMTERPENLVFQE